MSVSGAAAGDLIRGLESMANVLRGSTLTGAFSAFTASGNFEVGGNQSVTSLNTLIFGRGSGFDGYVLVDSSGTLIFRIGATSIDTGLSVTAGAYFVWSAVRTSGNILFTVNASTNTVANSETLVLATLGYNSATTYNSYAGDIKSLVLDDGTTRRTYDGNQTSGTVLPDTTSSLDITLTGGYTWYTETADTTAPVITVSGSASTTISQNGTAPAFTATAIDNADGDITADIVVSGDTVDPTTIGTYVIRYNVDDSSGNSASEVTRTVIVQAVSVVADSMNITWEGDSRTFGTGSDPVLPIANRVAALVTPTPIYTNLGVGGQMTVDAITNFSDNVPQTFDATKEFNIYLINGFGINDISGYSPFNNYTARTSAAIIGSLTTLCNDAKALGFDVVIATIPPRQSNTTAMETVRGQVNAWILSEAIASIDYSIDLNADDRIGVWSSTYYDDVSHLNYAGQDIWAGVIANFINATYYNANQAPTANAGSNLTIAAGGQANVGGIDTLYNGATVTSIVWTVPAGQGSLDNINSASPSYTGHLPASSTAVTLTKTITDSNGLTGTATVVITVQAATQQNLPPIVNLGGNRTVASGSIVTLDASNSSDTDGQIASYSWAQLSGDSVDLSSEHAAVATFIAPAGPQVLRFEVTLTDNENERSAGIVEIEVVANSTVLRPSYANRILINSELSCNKPVARKPPLVIRNNNNNIIKVAVNSGYFNSLGISNITFSIFNIDDKSIVYRRTLGHGIELVGDDIEIYILEGDSLASGHFQYELTTEGSNAMFIDSGYITVIESLNTV